MLTHAEKRVLEVLKQNPIASTKAIAETLGKSPRTIENQLASIFRKLNIDGNAGESKTTRLMLEIGWFKPENERKIPT